jgi:hypothetical protein
MGTITRRTDNAGKATYQVKIRREGYPPLSQTFAEKVGAETWMQKTEAAMTRGPSLIPLGPATRPLTTCSVGMRRKSHPSSAAMRLSASVSPSSDVSLSPKPRWRT